MYEYEEGKDQRQKGKINVEFYPNSKNPQFIIYDSYKITNKDDQRAILEYIMESEFYSQDVYRRSIDSMLIEWDAHNDIYKRTGHDRVADTNFDKKDEDTTYLGYWYRAFLAWLNGEA
ncbi:MAG: hypothetical protein IJW29_05830 [Clostridia bacterium]|nr:hypothetical protein [Clostridia bacterium]